jgi:hypothetical protein
MTKLSISGQTDKENQARASAAALSTDCGCTLRFAAYGSLESTGWMTNSHECRQPKLDTANETARR